MQRWEGPTPAGLQIQCHCFLCIYKAAEIKWWQVSFSHGLTWMFGGWHYRDIIAACTDSAVKSDRKRKWWLCPQLEFKKRFFFTGCASTTHVCEDPQPTRVFLKAFPLPLGRPPSDVTDSSTRYESARVVEVKCESLGSCDSRCGWVLKDAREGGTSRRRHKWLISSVVDLLCWGVMVVPVWRWTSDIAVLTWATLAPQMWTVESWNRRVDRGLTSFLTVCSIHQCSDVKASAHPTRALDRVPR